MKLRITGTNYVMINLMLVCKFIYVLIFIVLAAVKLAECLMRDLNFFATKTNYVIENI